MTFQRVQTGAGWHLRHVAANHEPVVVGEPLNDPDSVITALASLLQDAVRACGLDVALPASWSTDERDTVYRRLAFHALVDVDERTTQ